MLYMLIGVGIILSIYLAKPPKMGGDKKPHIDNRGWAGEIILFVPWFFCKFTKSDLSLSLFGSLRKRKYNQCHTTKKEQELSAAHMNN